ncbi:IclR family transcriptional regulator [Sciscionella sediminilitoris]|uniref:IclR family transcriptional regulator n=1 Tax=Sciscionella sediminilitoris TaxID=1445613 RepID=UPI0004DF9D6C|nr:IclR family transcriptional regulator C-terminal domain-containing protein [Sciscionella sp. SE31]
MTVVHGAELSSMERGLQVLAFVQDRGQADVAEIMAGLDLPSSTTYRYVRLLKNAGFLVEVGGQLSPSARLADRSVDSSEHLIDLARPLLTRLRGGTGFSVALTVRVHNAALCLDTRRSGSGSIAFRPGEILTLYAGASATPLLAFAPGAVRRQVLGGRLTRYTAVTPSAQTLRTELAAIRADGYHRSRGWLTPGMTAIGVPVIAGGTCVCALSLIGKDREFPETGEPVRILRAAAEELAARLPAEQNAWLPPDEKHEGERE